MTTYTQDKGRVSFGTLSTARSPQEQALDAIGEAVPQLEAALGFALSVQAQVQADGFIWVEAFLPDEQHTTANSRCVGKAIRDAARPFTELVYVETDSAAPYEQ